ncbi:HAMP domain-containing histidine kinase [Xanthomonas cucurbitae]|uniref:histidine kinase n=2 Tax=Xanthomonas cucurbitae TaxID=56453 RepID=A0A2S7DWV8_9XANT|nr:HAMP domain-containing sensor histidine kinase [Xanthomonas cucurbitae]PPU78260.1 two-component sensor histidine kinase [Xanthomonas cucurbitae]WDM68690.1 HAMP domain-containing histidine kinase [Xanthomonas cucurbitae]WDM72563.1 HAMP domain-containing histidine kinase [Xanthomonas cucurbitae]WDM76345.1 HAMP domain-containing histidine kinase [Xanthomonas cucurbitae]WDM78213.1 HAMP domain-containing histidine kinase [Xanthomonas cucurbitae]
MEVMAASVAMARQPPLGRRVMVWLFGYTLLMTLAVFATAQYLHERAEHGVWRALLNSELDSILERSARNRAYRWQDSDTLRLYRVDGAEPVPPILRTLHPGLHDELQIGGRQSAVMVRDTPQAGRLALVLDITDFEALEKFLTRWMLAAGIALIGISVVMGRYAMTRLVRPLAELARDIGALRPERRAQQITVGVQGSAELYVIADALNDYLERNRQFVERERAFIDSASHELRTPIAVIGNAVELALEQPGTPPAVCHQLKRIAQTSASVEQLITLLLVLAKDPGRLVRSSDAVRLDQLLPEIVADHAHLCVDKDLQVVIDPLPACSLTAPVAIVQTAIGNLLRNAIENSDRGVIRVGLSAPGVVRIADPGHGMTPEEISAIYARLARGDARQGNGIGLELIGRLCAHLGWHLQLESDTGQGTVATLDLSGAAAVGESRTR